MRRYLIIDSHRPWNRIHLRSRRRPDVALVAEQPQENPAPVPDLADVRNIGAAALALAMFATAIASGLKLGALLAGLEINSRLRIAAATLSITLFISMAEKIIAR